MVYQCIQSTFVDHLQPNHSAVVAFFQCLNELDPAPRYILRDKMHIRRSFMCLGSFMYLVINKTNSITRVRTICLQFLPSLHQTCTKVADKALFQSQHPSKLQIHRAYIFPRSEHGNRLHRRSSPARVS